MNNHTEITVSQHHKLFVEANKNFNLKQLYNRIENIKIQQHQQPLTDLEQVCLRGLLCGYTPNKIAQKLVGELDPFQIHLTFWTLFRYIQIMAGREEERITNYQDIISSLEASGYKSENVDTILIDESNCHDSLAAIKQVKVEPNLEESSTEDVKNTALVPQSQPHTLAHQPRQNILTQVDENDFMPAISPWTRLGGLFLVGSVGIAIALSALTPYKVIVKANAAIRPDGRIKVVQAETPGTIVSIQAQENQTIKQGDIIATIDNSSLETEAHLLQNQIQQSQLQLQQISAQISALNRQIIAEQERINNSIAETEIALNQSLRTYRDLQITTTAEAQEAQANLNLAQVELKQAQAELQSAQATLESQIIALKSAATKRDRYQKIADSGALSQDRIEETSLAYQQQAQEVKSQQATVERYQSAILRQQQAIAAAQARLDNMGAALNPSNGEITIAKKRITQTKASGEATLANLNREREALKQQAIDTQKQLERHQRQLKQTLKESDRTIVKAPTSGTLFQLNLRNSGQNVQSGTEIARIAPKNTSLIAKAYVSPQDINQVTIGQSTQLRISACPYPDYGTLKGKVIQVSPDALPISDRTSQDTTSQNTSSTQGLYEVTIQPKSLTLNQGNNQCTLQLGMEGRADIITKEETILKFLLRKARLIVDL